MAVWLEECSERLVFLLLFDSFDWRVGAEGMQQGAKRVGATVA